MIIFYGTEDAYGEGKAVPELKRLLQKSSISIWPPSSTLVPRMDSIAMGLP
jgi:hypothetical protein